MTPDLDQLNETFLAHESLVPDADSVLAKSHEIARNLKRRQWAVRATGGAMLGSALVVGGIGLPGLLHHSANNAVIDTASDGTGTATAPEAPATDPYTAFFNAGYTYDDAAQLAQLWHDSGPDAVGNAKAEAGAKLMKGQTLPIPPSGEPASAEEIAMQTYWNAGYDSEDAVRLGQIWHESDLSKVKVDAGKKLENGEQLPIQPSAPAVKGGDLDSAEVGAAQAFFDAGYTYDDAVELAGIWNVGTYQAKVDAGQKLEKGQGLPVDPSGQPASDDQQAIDAYFAAGYDYDDAVALGKIWHESDIGKVKAEAGHKIENGEQLPISH